MPDDLELISPEDVFSGRFLPPEMMRDLQVLARIDNAMVARFAESLDQEPGVLSLDRLIEITRQHFDEDGAVDAVVRTLQNVRPRDTRQLFVLVDRWRHLNEEREKLLPDVNFQLLQHNIALLVKEHSALELMRKSQRLLRDTGNEIENAMVICDLRPVFDTAHNRIEGFVAIATLCIRYIRQNGERDVFEVCLTEDEVSSLIESADDALKKLRVMKESISWPRTMVPTESREGN